MPRGIVARRMKAFCAEQMARGQQSSPQPEITRQSSKGGGKEPSKSKSEWDLRKLGDDSPKTQQVGEKLASPKQLKQTRAEYMEQLEASPNDLPVRDGTPSVASNYLDLNSTPRE